MTNIMVDKCHVVWNNCLQLIKAEIQEQSFKTWFEPIKAVKLENNVLTIEIPNPFYYEWLEEHYLHLLKKVIVSELGNYGKLEYSMVVDKGGDTNAPLTLRVRDKEVPAQRSTPPVEPSMPAQQNTQASHQPQSEKSIDNNTDRPAYPPAETELPTPVERKPSVPVQKEVEQGPVSQYRNFTPGAPQGKPQQPAYSKKEDTSGNAGGGNVKSAYINPFKVPDFQDGFDSQLNDNLTFGTYIEGDCNRLARSAGIAVAEKPGRTSFNPLVIYGGVGLGKTHLAQAIGNEIKVLSPHLNVLYVSTEQFTSQFIEALKTNDVQRFTNFYLQIDVLIIDDIQFLAGKEKTQENFFHIFNRLHQNCKQIIMTSDCAPKDMKGLQERLLSRFKWGLVTDVQTPDLETRIAIVHTKMEAEGVLLPEDVIEYIASNINSNVRELEGAFISLIANSSLMRKDIDIELAKATLVNIVKNSDQKEITVDFIQQIVADYFNISVDELISRTRKKDIAMARQIAMYFSKEYTSLPLKSIGNHFGGRDHSTVVHASKAVTKKLDVDDSYSRILEVIEEKIK